MKPGEGAEIYIGNLASGRHWDLCKGFPVLRVGGFGFRMKGSDFGMSSCKRGLECSETAQISGALLMIEMGTLSFWWACMSSEF